MRTLDYLAACACKELMTSVGHDEEAFDRIASLAGALTPKRVYKRLTGCNLDAGYASSSSQARAQFFRCVHGLTKIAEWVRSQRYGLMIDDDLIWSLQDAQYDVEWRSLHLPWSPMVFRFMDQEEVAWEDSGGLHFFGVGRHDDGSVGFIPTVAMQELTWYRKAMVLIGTCSLSMKDGVGELRAGARLVAVFPFEGLSTFRIRHKIADDAEFSRGSWVRRGHWRRGADGAVWCPAAIHRADDPFVLRTHSVEEK